MKRRLVVVGDSMLDRDHRGRGSRLAPDAPVPVIEDVRTQVRPGGAALAAQIAAGMDLQVTLVTAIADDIDGLELAESLLTSGVELHGLRASGHTRTKERVIADEQVIARLDRGGQHLRPGQVDAEALAAVFEGASAILVSDYGAGVLANPELSLVLRRTTTPIVWDPHPRGECPLPGVKVVTPNEAEANFFAEEPDPQSIVRVATNLRDKWRADSVAITLGKRGAVLVSGDLTLYAPTTAVAGDTCGAGDAFAVAIARAVAYGEQLSTAVTDAVAFARSWVGRVEAPTSSPARTAGSVRAAGGRIVATGGCFDLLHPGHLATLSNARSLGDYLIVCINSDRSVRDLKGPSRPFVSASDRKLLLEALEVVDEVVIFDEPTPDEVLQRIKPDIWVKGGDYDVVTLPERETVAKWGGEVVTVPYLDGRSTTAIAQSISSVIDLRVEGR